MTMGFVTPKTVTFGKNISSQKGWFDLKHTNRICKEENLNLNEMALTSSRISFETEVSIFHCQLSGWSLALKTS